MFNSLYSFRGLPLRFGVAVDLNEGKLIYERYVYQPHPDTPTHLERRGDISVIPRHHRTGQAVWLIPRSDRPYDSGQVVALPTGGYRFLSGDELDTFVSSNQTAIPDVTSTPTQEDGERILPKER